MRLTYSPATMLVLGAAVLGGAGSARAQAGDTLVVKCTDASFAPIPDALRDAIETDTNRPAGRVYKLERGDICLNRETITNSGFHLRIVGETRPSSGQDFGPATIQMITRADGSVNGRMITGQDHLTLRNLWFSGQDNTGATTAYHPIQFEANDKNIVIDNVIFERSDFAFMGVAGRSNDVYITNSRYRNFVNKTQQWEGRGIRFEAGADTLVMENNTFFNLGMTVIQSEAEPINYVRFNHNTMVNIGRTLNAGSIWKTGFFANNLVVNGFWHGEGYADYSQPNRLSPTTGWFGIAALPAAFGSELERRIYYGSNAHWRDPAFAAYYADTIRAQPLFNSETLARFNGSNIKFENNVEGTNPGLPTYTTAPTVTPITPGKSYPAIPLSGLVGKMINKIKTLRAGSTAGATYYWDPGRDSTLFEPAGFIWPLQENFAYTNATLRTAGTDGLPLGDLNWFPAQKATFLANRAAYVASLEAKAQADVAIVQATQEAEVGALTGTAAVEAFPGFTFYRFEAAGSIQWDFNVAQAGTYGLRVNTNLGTETQRGQRIILNGTNLRNNSGFGEYYFCSAAQAGCATPLPASTWTKVELTSATLIEGGAALTLNAGANRLRLEPSWGYQSFAEVELVDGAGNVVQTLRPPDAVAQVAIPNCQDAPYCPSGFKSVSLGPSGTASYTFRTNGTGDHLLRIFYQAPAGATQGDILVDGTPVLNGFSFAGAAGDEAGRDVLTSRFTLAAGTHTVTIANAPGLKLDFVQVISVNALIGVDRDGSVAGLTLRQNYPNPAAGTARIEYALAQTQAVRLALYDLLGRQVALFVDGVRPAGPGVVEVNTGPLSAGLYFYRLETAGGSQTRTMTVVR